jgi:uncharacterized protein (UPF0248 family)
MSSRTSTKNDVPATALQSAPARMTELSSNFRQHGGDAPSPHHRILNIRDCTPIHSPVTCVSMNS